MSKIPLFVATALAVLASLACSTSSTTDVSTAKDVGAMETVSEMTTDDTIVFPDLRPVEMAAELRPFEQDADPDVLEPQCKPGDGCLLDECSENSDCLSGWCVEHMGEGVCTIPCQDECPDGWTCKMLGGTGPDPVFICLSDFGNLCKPCAATADCTSAAGTEDVCLNYGHEGSFCGGACELDSDCPWGFTCKESQTVDGVLLTQCVADAGVCPCSTRSIELGLWTPCQEANEWGTCEGKRICTHEGLSACDAGLPAEESCNGLDDDCDGALDEPLEVGGNYINLCDDDNECTIDTCQGEPGCSYEALDEGECKDGDSCTVGDHCVGGTCIGAPIQCDDDNPCTDDSCDGLGGCLFDPNLATCDDGEACTVGDKCSDSICAGTLVPCDCQVDEDCAALEDGDLCNGTLICDNQQLPFQCVIGPDTAVECPAPEGTEALCLTASCDPITAACSLVPANEGLPCEDGDDCTWGETCQTGECAGAKPLNCNDGNPCTDDSCEPGIGCSHTDNIQPCEDGDSCTTSDVCAGGVCVGGEAGLACDDGNPCTADSCENGVGCNHLAVAGICDDGNPCTDGDHCQDGDCEYTGATLCADDNPCTADSCDPAIGCVFVLHDGACNDDSLCTTGDHCHLGECIASGQLACNDGNDCSDDSCDPQVGCVFTPNQADCDDQNACTTGDHCENNVCTFSGATPCADDDPCTSDTCDPAIGCVFEQHTGPCDDDDVCTVGDHCQAGECTPTGQMICNDGNVCTDDSCDPQAGCTFAPNIDVCDDDNPCTKDDKCAGGWCIAGAMLDCDDNNLCTDDSCDPVQECVNVPNQESCDDSNVCTDDSCDAQLGCQYDSNSADCPGGKCSSGQCVPSQACQKYVNGNDAYWFERKEGFRDVCVGGGDQVYVYNSQLKQYRKGDTVLLPNKVSKVNGDALSANGFYGFSGGSPSDSSYHWDKVTNASAPQPSVWDITNMFISPLSGTEFHYCKALNWNAPDCNNTVIDGPVDTLAYPNHSPKNGTYNLNQSAEQINAGVLVGSQTTWISQQQLDQTAHPSYCVATYGRGWRLPTDIEMGHTTDSHGWNAGLDPSYNTTNNANYHMWSSSRYLPLAKGHLFILWPLGTGQNGYWDGNGVSATNQRTRCVFPGGSG